MLKKIIKELKVTVTFEPSRTPEAHLAKTYEITMPLVKRLMTSETTEMTQENQIQDKE